MLQQWVHTWHARQKSLEDKIRQLIYGSVGDAKLGKLATKHTDLDITPQCYFSDITQVSETVLSQKLHLAGG